VAHRYRLDAYVYNIFAAAEPAGACMTEGVI